MIELINEFLKDTTVVAIGCICAILLAAGGLLCCLKEAIEEIIEILQDL